MLKALANLEQSINRFSERMGNIISWLMPALAATAFFTVVLRYIFNQNPIWLQDAVTYIHASVLMLCMGYTEYLSKHVRVDIFYQTLPEKKRCLINAIGHTILLIPVCIVITVYGFEYALHSWLLLEKSLEVGGLPLVFVLKTLIPLMGFLLLMQSLSSAIHNIRKLLKE